jgi:hypothetical protein
LIGIDDDDGIGFQVMLLTMVIMIGLLMVMMVAMVAIDMMTNVVKC